MLAESSRRDWHTILGLPRTQDDFEQLCLREARWAEDFIRDRDALEAEIALLFGYDNFFQAGRYMALTFPEDFNLEAFCR